MQKSDNKQSKSNSDCTNPHIKSIKYAQPSGKVEKYKLFVLCNHNLKKMDLDWQ